MRGVFTSSEAELSEVDGIGDVIAQSVSRWWELPMHRDLVDRLEVGGVVLDINDRAVLESEALEHTLEGRAVVITGTVPGYTRDEAGAAVVARGGTSPGSVSKKTFALVVGEEQVRQSSRRPKVSAYRLLTPQILRNFSRPA